MRWKQTQLRNLDTRIRSGFLFFPRCCGGQWRWLERATWEQKLYSCYTDCFWENVRWIDPVRVANGWHGIIFAGDHPPGPLDRDKIWYDTRDGVFRFWENGAWMAVKK